MRKILLLIFLCTCTWAWAAENRIYFYPEFVKTKIVYKDGTQFQVIANYDVANKKVMYMQGQQLMEMVSPHLVDSIFLGGSVWVYHNYQFCEVIQREGKPQILAGWYIRKIHKGYEGAYGTSQIPSKKLAIIDNVGMGDIPLMGGADNVANHVNQGNGNSMNRDVWKAKNQSTYYFTKNGKEYAVKGMKSVLKAFPTKKDQIKQYVHDNHIDTLTAEGMLQVIDYLMTL